MMPRETTFQATNMMLPGISSEQRPGLKLWLEALMILSHARERSAHTQKGMTATGQRVESMHYALRIMMYKDND